MLFYTARHHCLDNKLANITLPDYLHNCIVHNLSSRQHQTKIKGYISSMFSINASIIQDSALSPVEYIFTASDLGNIIPTNRLCKYTQMTPSWFQLGAY